MTEIEIINHFSNNVRQLRISKNLSQIELGKALNYSSKAISKWENGDTLPDVITMNKIAEFFNITIDDLISNKAIKISHKNRNRLLITIVSSLLPFFISAITFLILQLCNINNSWYSFIFALPVSAIVLIVFTSLWYKKIYIILSSIYLVISSALLAMILMNFYFWWIILIMSLILIILIIIFFNINFHSSKKTNV